MGLHFAVHLPRVVQYHSMLIGQKFTRTAPDGREHIIVIETQKHKEYHQELQDHGYKYSPIVQVHSSPQDVCLACQG